MGMAPLPTCLVCGFIHGRGYGFAWGFLLLPLLPMAMKPLTTTSNRSANIAAV